MAGYFEHTRKVQNQKDAEANGRVADSLDVRMALIKRMEAGEITLEEVQSELKKIKKNAKREGKITRSQAYRGY